MLLVGPLNGFLPLSIWEKEVCRIAFCVKPPHPFTHLQNHPGRSFKITVQGVLDIALAFSQLEAKGLVRCQLFVCLFSISNNLTIHHPLENMCNEHMKHVLVIWLAAAHPLMEILDDLPDRCGVMIDLDVLDCRIQIPSLNLRTLHRSFLSISRTTHTIKHA